jgi:cyclophilin family peptidyl-prolyl cis-trans isomerase
MRKIIFTALILMLLIISSSSFPAIQHEKFINEFDEEIKNIGFDNNPLAYITTSMGLIVVELYQDLAPNTVDNFIKLVEDGFYEGLVFHRVVDDFLIQAGGYYPDGSFKASPYGTIDLEIHPSARHVDGAIGMARTNDPNSATSQFYICDGSQPFLDDDYAVFGKVKASYMSPVRNIAALPFAQKYGHTHWPAEDVIIEEVEIVEDNTEENPNIDVFVMGGLAGFKVKIHNKNQYDYNGNITIFGYLYTIPGRQQYIFSSSYSDPIPAKGWVTLKIKEVNPLIHIFRLVDITIGLYLTDNHEHTDGSVSQKGLVIAPFIFMMPREITY